MGKLFGQQYIYQSFFLYQLDAVIVCLLVKQTTKQQTENPSVSVVECIALKFEITKVKIYLCALSTDNQQKIVIFSS